MGFLSFVEPITSGHILSVLPFGNTADILELKGRHLLDALEHSVHNYNPQFPAGAFLQVSGKYFRESGPNSSSPSSYLNTFTLFLIFLCGLGDLTTVI